ncbi:endolytic transglycosylase MltG [Oceaniserpentilla sp. 4NH20-0058]|uniref:endolytic transglycosylase MltG n=1 Tax=Oceaniserpentilla sp. 4NH20-0058 TaxID=3127660 RepID=UPI00310C2E68
MRKRISLLMIMLLIWFLALMIYGMFQLQRPLNISEKQVVALEKGRPVSSFFMKLERENWMQDSRWIMLVAKLSGKSRLAKAGEYELTPQMNSWDVLDTLIKGKSVQYKITLVEGQNVHEMMSRLAANDKLIQDLPSDVSQLMTFLGLEGHPEGRFFPDTYQFHRNTRASEILVRAQIRLETVLAEEWREREEGLPYKTPYEALVMASIVEKETAAPEEREMIAGVFVRRLQKRMRLETDPTVIYGLGDRYKGNIRKKHLREKTAYNTYRMKGLPPTPIAMVGREAIHAALHPADGEELYFVAKGDGRHQFSSTLAEHNKAVRHYQIYKRKDEYRSTPTDQ